MGCKAEESVNDTRKGHKILPFIATHSGTTDLKVLSRVEVTIRRGLNWMIGYITFIHSNCVYK
jgi:hypothetical protein